MTRPSPDGVPDGPIKVGTLASRFGLTVRTLHHYDAIGLLSPSARTRAGHRVYARPDLVRLDRIQFLRSLGLSLPEIAPLLDDPGFSAKRELDAQIVRLQQDVVLQQRLISRLQQLSRHLDAGAIHGVEHLSDLVSASMRREAVTSPGDVLQEEWTEILVQVRQHLRDGTSPNDPDVQQLAIQWRTLMQERAYRAGSSRPAGAVAEPSTGAAVTLGLAPPQDFAPDVYEYLAAMLAAAPADVPDGRRQSGLPRRRNDPRGRP